MVAGFRPAAARPVFRDLHWRLEPGERWHALSGGGCTALLRLCAGVADAAPWANGWRTAT